MLSCSSVKYDTIKTIILKDAHNIDEILHRNINHHVFIMCALYHHEVHFMNTSKDFNSAYNHIKVHKK